MNSQAKKILIIAGGTGGHIFPALVVADELQKNHWDVFWLGSYVGLENKLVPPNFHLHRISMKGIRGKSLLTRFLAPFRLLMATLQALRVIKQINPDVVLGMGGFISLPGGIAAWLLRKPLIIHEQNSIAGYTNRILARLARVTLSGFPDSFPKSLPAKVIGNPIRSEIIALSSPSQRLLNRSNKLNILVLGGSQGAHVLNEWMPKVLERLPQRDQVTVWHQTGEQDYEHTSFQYQKLPIKANVEKFIKEMANAYSWADVAICRAGALTVSELAAAGVASILIPFPYAVDNHQYYNGRYLELAGGAYLIEQKNVTIEKIVGLLTTLIEDRDKILQMSEGARNLALPNSAKEVVNTCLQLT